MPCSQNNNNNVKKIFFKDFPFPYRRRGGGGGRAVEASTNSCKQEVVEKQLVKQCNHGGLKAKDEIIKLLKGKNSIQNSIYVQPKCPSGMNAK